MTKHKIPAVHPRKVKAYGRLNRGGATIEVVKWYPQCTHDPTFNAHQIKPTNHLNEIYLNLMN